MAKANRLNKRILKQILTGNKNGVYGDGNTLFLRKQGGRLSWVQIIRMGGKRVERGLGGYPIVDLDEAREIAFANRRKVRRGENPWAKTDSERQVVKPSVPTFADGLEAVIAIKRDGWKGATSERHWRSSIRDHAARLLDRRVDDIEAKDVLACVEPIWHEKHVTAGHVKARIAAVMNWSIAKGYRKENPVNALDAVLPRVKRKVQHRTALSYAEVPATMVAIAAGKGYAGANLALRFLILTAARSGEVRESNWCEISRDRTTWTIPADRMKAGNEHVVPLSDAATDVLLEAAKFYGGIAGPIFPAPKGGIQQDSRLREFLQAAKIPAVPHGFRSTFRDWSAEHGYERDVAEAALAHTVRNQVEAAYRRTDFLNKRRTMMEQWGKFCVSEL